MPVNNPEIISDTHSNTEVETTDVVENDNQEAPSEDNDVVDENNVSNDDIEEVNESPFSKAEEPKNDKSPWEV